MLGAERGVADAPDEAGVATELHRAGSVDVMRIATGEVQEAQEPENPAAVLGRCDSAARAKALTPEKWREIARGAAAWRRSKPE
jgi:hypothetical protein